MNATESAPKMPNSGLKRVRQISAILKGMVLVYLFVIPLIFNITRSGPATWTVAGHAYAGWSDFPVSAKLIAGITVALWLAMAIVFYRLLNLYERGIIFSFQNARLLRALGYLVFSYGLLAVVAPVVMAGFVPVTGLLLGIVGSPWVTGGLFGIMVSAIMDEGCKMREEQELTV